MFFFQFSFRFKLNENNRSEGVYYIYIFLHNHAVFCLKMNRLIKATLRESRRRLGTSLR